MSDNNRRATTVSGIRFELRIDWSEIDLFGHVNNLAIMKYIQAARVNYLEMIGLMRMQSEMGIGPILASTSCQFRKPLFYPGQVAVYSKVDTIKTTSFPMLHEMLDDQGDIVAQAHDVIVFYDFGRNSKLKIPDEIREKIREAGSSSVNPG